MKMILFATLLAAGITATGAVNADSGEDLAKKSGCLACHAIDTKKVGPPYQDVAKKFKGKPETDVVAAMKAKPVHASVKVSDGDLKEIAAWIQKL